MNDIIFSKYHALGNDYIVINPEDISEECLNSDQVKMICHRNFGVGSDGILLGPTNSTQGDFGLRIYNPDCSEAEKSGNGLRIFSRYLWDKGFVEEMPFTILTEGGLVKSQVFENGGIVSVYMGKVSFMSDRIPVRGPQREVINEKIAINNEDLIFNAATIGNPHCVVVCDKLAPERVKELGADICHDSLNATVQRLMISCIHNPGCDKNHNHEPTDRFSNYNTFKFQEGRFPV